MNKHCIVQRGFPCLFLELPEATEEQAQQRLEELICINVATVAALTHLPVHVISGTEVHVHFITTYFQPTGFKD